VDVASGGASQRIAGQAKADDLRLPSVERTNAIGYGGTVSIPNWGFVMREINVVGNFIGNYTELNQILALAARGKVKVHTLLYPLAEINQAIADLRD
jgi:D-arabinose 1-dehydrogenase-like Zn-dependent alcohol dehydrogenase